MSSLIPLYQIKISTRSLKGVPSFSFHQLPQLAFLVEEISDWIIAKTF